MKKRNKHQPVTGAVTHTLRRKTVHKYRLPLQALLLSTSMTLSPIAQAGGAGTSLNTFFNDLGYNTNVTNPNTFKGQTANYYNAGNLFVRSKVTTLQLAKLTAPSISAGCGGIDAFLGGFSHINSDKLVQFGKSIIANAAPFAVNLALQTWAPSLNQIMGQLQEVSDKWLNQSINSCEAAQAGVQGLAMFAGGETKKTLCATMGTQDNVFSDWVSARQECGAGNQSAPQLANARNNPVMKDMTKTNHNIMWDALLEEPVLSADKVLAEFFMALTGTLIYDAAGKSTYYPSLLTHNEDMVNVLLTGGKAQTYLCANRSKKACLSLSTTSHTISATDGLQSRLIKKLDELHAKVMTDTALTDTEKSFVSYTEIPVLNFTLRQAERSMVLNSDAYAKVIATELLTRYLTKSLNMAESAIQNTAVDPADVALMVQAIKRAGKYAAALSRQAKADKNILDDMIRNAQEQQEMINVGVSKDISKNLAF